MDLLRTLMPPRRLRPASGRAQLLAKVLAAVLSLAVVAAFATFAAFERRETLDHALDRSELIARTLEDHVTRTVESAALILRTLGESVDQQPVADARRLQPLLGQPLLNGLPFLRGAAVLDLDGQVLASTLPAE